MEINKDYYRPITRHKYIGLSKLDDSRIQSRLSKEIYVKPIEINYPEYIKFCSINHQFYSQDDKTDGIYHICGTIASFIFLTAIHLIPLLCYEKETDWNHPFIFVTYIAIFFFLFCPIYYFTMPKKEYILNRIDGTITFPGWLWSKSITMSFEEVKFTLDRMSLLCIVRPNLIGTLEDYTIWGISNLQSVPSNSDSNENENENENEDNYITGWQNDLAFITWFMDKNRPLPPGNAFDPYRDIDFKRRKAEKFKHTLYPSYIPTPEATPEQQKEYDKYWKKDANFFGY